jgi:hypothetical protein
LRIFACVSSCDRHQLNKPIHFYCTFSSSTPTADEGHSVGSSHHLRRKTRNRSSIDWTLISGSQVPNIVNQATDVDTRPEITSEDATIPTLEKEKSSCVRLPNFADRLTLMGQTSQKNARWFPYAYEVIIMQWCAILVAQRRSTDTDASKDESQNVDSQYDDVAHPGSEELGQAAIRSSGVSVAAAPMLFEIIKQSLGFRILANFREATRKKCGRLNPPLVVLDETLLLNLELAISMVTDACLDARNFDSWELRQMSIDVNDSIIRFLRDMFGFLAPVNVHRLILVFLSRFVTKDGKQWQDRDSNIGLRCSWEITKLRLNAVTALVRFPDFIRVNGLETSRWDKRSQKSTGSVYDDILCRFERFRLPDFVGTEDTPRRSQIDMPPMMPHWLSEIVVDICLMGTCHAEQYIQNRSASLLHELFWTCSQYGVLEGRSSAIGSMFATFLEKVLQNVSYISSFQAKSQLRKDIIPCTIFVLQTTPNNLLRSLWRRLLARLSGSGNNEKYGVAQPNSSSTATKPPTVEHLMPPHILDLFSFLNLCLKSMEYEGCEENLDELNDSREGLNHWRNDFLSSLKPEYIFDDKLKKTRRLENQKLSLHEMDEKKYTTSISRRWLCHDGAIVVVNTAHNIVLEMYAMLSSSSEGRSYLNPAVKTNTSSVNPRDTISGTVFNSANSLHYADVVVFVRAAASVYLLSLSLPGSDIVIGRTFRVAGELIKVFGIRVFLEAVGETLQHWMRTLSFLCGARRAQARVEATDLLELILRSTWECYGSFFRVRVPLLAVQTEVMERIVATAAARFYRDQRRTGATSETFSNLSAEASLVPLWRTLDRIEKQPASQNIAFRGALIRMAGKLKKLYRAYIAARVLSFLQGMRSNDLGTENDQPIDREAESLIRARRISMMRVINASDGYSKQFLGFQGTTQARRINLAHYEAVEDALVDAADVFSPTELPEHRVAWLRMLADFHATRKKFAEEATCHFYIHTTLQQAARLHGSLWSNTPFLPWTDNMPDPVYFDGDRDVPSADAYLDSDLDFDSTEEERGRRMDSANSFRRIFYRVANSVGMAGEEWENGSSKNAFYGVTSASEYYTVSTWISHREMEENMVEEAEAAGELFLQAGIIESSRFAWNLATQYYAEKFNYTKLAIAYTNLATTVVTKVPSLDTTLPQEVSATLGRFYRVWFHGGAPDELSGVEFVYRAEGAVRLDQFGDQLRDVIKSIIPEKTPIHLLLDGRVEGKGEEATTSYGFSRIGPAPLEPVRIKVTPLRPLSASASSIRGRPEWFRRYAEETFSGRLHRPRNEAGVGRGHFRNNSRRSNSQSDFNDTHHRDHARSFSATVLSSTGHQGMKANVGARLQHIGDNDRVALSVGRGEGELSGVDKFCFVQPKDREMATNAWWKSASGDFAEKSLKVTQLQVSQSFPACVARQVVVHRLVYPQSPLEAGVDAICQWCAVLFRTAVATVGQAVLRRNSDPGIGTNAAKVVADCIHNSNVKEICLALLRKKSDSSVADSDGEFILDYDRLTDDEITKLRVLIARLAVVFIELLHLLIARNRDMLLDTIQERKKNTSDGASMHGGSQFNPGSLGRASNRSGGVAANSVVDHRRESSDPSPVLHYRNLSLRDGRIGRENTGGSDGSRPHTHTSTQSADVIRQKHRYFGSDASIVSGTGTLTGTLATGAHSSKGHKRVLSGEESVIVNSSTLTDSAIAVQSELQRAFVNFCKTLYPRIQGIMQEETPLWLKQCAQDRYFSFGSYKNLQLPIAEELCFNASERVQGQPMGYVVGNRDADNMDSPRGSICGGSAQSGVSKGSDRLSFNLEK